MTTLAFTPAQPPFTGLAPKLTAHNATHRQCMASARDAALWAALTGLELMAQRHTLPHGAWMPWVAKYCEFSQCTANAYLRAAQRAMANLREFGMPWGSDKASEVKVQLCEMLTRDGLDETRATVIAGIGPVRARTVRLPKPKRYRAPRVTGPRPVSMQSLPSLIVRLRISPPEVLQALRDDFLDQAPIALRVA